MLMVGRQKDLETYEFGGTRSLYVYHHKASKGQFYAKEAKKKKPQFLDPKMSTPLAPPQLQLQQKTPPPPPPRWPQTLNSFATTVGKRVKLGEVV